MIKIGVVEYGTTDIIFFIVMCMFITPAGALVVLYFEHNKRRRFIEKHGKSTKD